jgi:transcriptional regulator with XRE-family HTH domain
MARELRRAQFECGLTQVQMARMLRVSPKHLNQVLMCRAGADHRTLDRWARRMGYRWRITLEKVRDHP